jgi:hypothetical protein
LFEKSRRRIEEVRTFQTTTTDDSFLHENATFASVKSRIEKGNVAFQNAQYDEAKEQYNTAWTHLDVIRSCGEEDDLIAEDYENEEGERGEWQEEEEEEEDDDDSDNDDSDDHGAFHSLDKAGRVSRRVQRMASRLYSCHHGIGARQRNQSRRVVFAGQDRITMTRNCSSLWMRQTRRR